MTRYTYAVLLVYPLAEAAGVNAFVREEIDPDGADWLTPALSPTGQAPATHGWFSFAATAAQAELWLARFAARLGGQVPAGFTTLPRDAQRQWMAGAQDALWQATGVYFQAVFNDAGEIPDPAVALTACGLARIVPATP